MDYLIDFFSGDGFLPHGHCYFWGRGVLWLNVGSDALIALAYMTIPFTLVYLIHKRRDIPFNWMFMAFGIFILACGATHIMDIWTTWYPAYWLSGYIRAITAVASVITACLLIKLIPVALSIPSQEQLTLVNAELTRSNVKLQQANQRLEETHRHLLQREKMAALGGLVAGVAHEINTPIGVIVTGSSLLAQNTQHLHDVYKQDGLSEEELEEYIATAEESTQLIQANAKRAANLIQSFKQVAVDQTAGEQRRINLVDYIGETLTSLAPVIKKASATVEVTGPKDLVINTYPGALAQILTNLVLNSLTHGFEDSSPGHICIAFEAIGDQIVLSYADSGKGIPVDLRSKVFEPFYTSKRNAGGSGLGLHILHNLVTSTLNGNVRIDDFTEERGVMFVMEFPFTTSPLMQVGEPA